MADLPADPFVTPAALNVVSAGAITVSVTIDAIDGADAYQLKYRPTSGGVAIAFATGTTELSHVIPGLMPETEYEISLYYLTNGAYVFDGSRIVSTLQNSAANYNSSDFGSNEECDLSGIDDLRDISEDLNDLFVTGDKISLSINGSDTVSYTHLTLPTIYSV